MTELLAYPLQAAVATAFLLALAGKARDVGAFTAAVAGLLGTTARRSRIVARAVVGAEGATVALLLWPASAAAGFALAAALLVAFSVALVTGLRRTLAPSCNCFGASQRPISWWDVARNGVLVACALAGALLALGGAPAARGGEVLLLVLPGVAAGMLVAHLHDVATSLARPLGPGR